MRIKSRFLCALVFLVGLTSIGHAQQLINCASSTPCTGNGPQNTGTGDNLPTAGTKLNTNFLALPTEFFSAAPLTQAHGGTGATSLVAASIPVFSGSITSLHCVEWINATTIGDAGAACGGGSSTTFQVNGTGLTSSGTVNFESSAATSGLTLTFTNPSAGNVQLGLTGFPALINGDCLTNNGTALSWGTCGGGGGAGFSAITTGTNTSATMTVGTGANIGVSGSGTITATAAPLTGISGLGSGIATFLATPSSANLAAAVTGATGTGALVFGTSPTLTTPTLGAATATSINGNTLTAGTYTLTGTAGKTLTFSNSLTLAGTDGTIMTFPATSGTVDTLNSAQTFTAVKTFTNSDLALLGSSTGATTFTSANASATTYTATVPANSGTLAELNLGQTWTGMQTFNGTLAGTAFASPPAIGGTAPAAGAFTTLSASSTLTTNVTGSTQCLQANSSGVVSGTGSACGSGGSTAFSGLTGGTNTAAAMVVGTGASLAVSGSGTIAATSAPLSGVSGLGTGIATALAVNVGTAGAPVVNGGALGTPSSGTLTNASGLPFSGVAGGTNTTAAMIVGTGASVAATGSGTIAATSLTVLSGLPQQAAETVVMNNTSSPAVPTAVTLANLQAAQIAANAQACTPTLVTGPTNDFDPTTGGTTCTVSGAGITNVGAIVSAAASGSTTIDGMLAGASMQEVIWFNNATLGSGNSITLVNQSSSDTTAANRFGMAGNLIIPPQQYATCFYMTGGSINRWLCR